MKGDVFELRPGHSWVSVENAVVCDQWPVRYESVRLVTSMVNRYHTAAMICAGSVLSFRKRHFLSLSSLLRLRFAPSLRLGRNFPISMRSVRTSPVHCHLFFQYSLGRYVVSAFPFATRLHHTIVICVPLTKIRIA